jgi:hypothetical protein
MQALRSGLLECARELIILLRILEKILGDLILLIYLLKQGNLGFFPDNFESRVWKCFG